MSGSTAKVTVLQESGLVIMSTVQIGAPESNRPSKSPYPAPLTRWQRALLSSFQLTAFNCQAATHFSETLTERILLHTMHISIWLGRKHGRHEQADWFQPICSWFVLNGNCKKLCFVLVLHHRPDQSELAILHLFSTRQQQLLRKQKSFTSYFAHISVQCFCKCHLKN